MSENVQQKIVDTICKVVYEKTKELTDNIDFVGNSNIPRGRKTSIVKSISEIYMLLNYVLKEFKLEEDEEGIVICKSILGSPEQWLDNMVDNEFVAKAVEWGK